MLYYKTQLKDGEILNLYGFYVCPHCNEVFGGALTIYNAISYKNEAYHPKCYPIQFTGEALKKIDTDCEHYFINGPDELDTLDTCVKCGLFKKKV